MNNQSLTDATPGPWESNGSLIVGNDGKTAVCQMGKTVTAAERKANARLVVHAPQMYAMLKDVAAISDPMGNSFALHNRIDSLINIIEAIT